MRYISIITIEREDGSQFNAEVQTHQKPKSIDEVFLRYAKANPTKVRLCKPVGVYIKRLRDIGSAKLHKLKLGKLKI